MILLIRSRSTIKEQLAPFFMTIEKTVWDFKLSNTFEEYEAHMNAPEQQAMFKEMGVSEVNWTLVREYGIIRRSANLDINWASAQIVNNLDKYERKDLMAWLITQTERVYLKALESNQLSAAIGSLNLMHRITIEAAEKKANKSYHRNCKF